VAAEDNLNQQQFMSMKAPVVKTHGIHHRRNSPEILFDGDVGADTSPSNWEQLSSHEPLYTKQTQLYKPAIRQYVDRPNNPEEFKDDYGYDVPQLYRFKDRLWVDEGHHRILASRLRGEASTTVAIRDMDY
jgi:hypothetical protein